MLQMTSTVATHTSVLDFILFWFIFCHIGQCAQNIVWKTETNFKQVYPKSYLDQFNKANF